MTPKILGPNGEPLRSTRRGPLPVRARYDAAQTTTENSNHWANADALSARAANSPEIRRTLRNRARYERDNNSYCSGMVETVASHTVGTGPRLQVNTPNRRLNLRLNAAFEEWTAAVGLAQKLCTFREARVVDGESFLLIVNNPRLGTPVQLDLTDIEADQIATPDLFVPTKTAVDGIEFDAYGNPTYYHLLESHPGDLSSTKWGGYTKIPAELVLHWFKRRRPGQARGVSELTPALPLYALLRRYGLATVSAAEIAALFAALLKSELPPDPDPETEALNAFDTQTVERVTMTVVPDGYEFTQLKPEQPTTNYEMFERAILRQIARCLHIPRSIAAGDSADLNYSSGRLDHQVYHWMIGTDRYFLETAVLDHIFREWVAEAQIVAPDLTAGLQRGEIPRHTWNWDGFKHVDPEKEANAQHQRLLNGTTTPQRECAEEGYSFEETLDELAEARRMYAERGIPYPGDPVPTTSPATTPNDPAAASIARNGRNGHAREHHT